MAAQPSFEINNNSQGGNEEQIQLVSYQSINTPNIGVEKQYIDFESLYPLPKQDDNGDEDNDEYDDEIYITPRMAYQIYYTGVSIVNSCVNSSNYFGSKITPSLPPCVRIFTKDKIWKQQFINCFRRICLRLVNDCKGLQPNCTGEEMAVHLLMSTAKNNARNTADWEKNCPQFKALPKHERDLEFDEAKEISVQDEDVMMLWDVQLKDIVNTATFINPAQWFLAFKKDYVQTHLKPTKLVKQA